MTRMKAAVGGAGVSLLCAALAAVGQGPADHNAKNSTVQEIGIDHVVLNTPSGPLRLKNDFVLALIGYHPDYDFLRSMGIELSEQQCRPVCDPVSLESNVKGIYVAGVIVAGSRTNEIFIENGRFHGKQIADDLRQKLKS